MYRLRFGWPPWRIDRRCSGSRQACSSGQRVCDNQPQSVSRSAVRQSYRAPAGTISALSSLWQRFFGKHSPWPVHQAASALGKEVNGQKHLGQVLMSSKILINENRDPIKPGAVDVYKTLEEAELSVEEWYVDVPHCALSENGSVMTLMRSGSAVKFVEREPKQKRLDLLEIFLKYHICEIARVHGWERLSVTEDQINNLRIPDLWDVALTCDKL